MKVTKRLMGLAAAIVVCAMLCLPGVVPGATPTAQADQRASYGISLVGTDITSDNAADIFGDGTASYDATTGTLTLDNFAATGNDAGGAMINARFNNLKINLVGENSLVSGTYETGVFSLGSLTFTGSGSLAVSGGYVATGSGSYAIFSKNYLTFDENFTGTVVATGGKVDQAADEDETVSAGIFSAHMLTVKNGTVIANGGEADFSMGVDVTIDGVDVQGGALIAQGGVAASASYGICGNANEANQCSFTGGIAVVRAGAVYDEDDDLVLGSQGRAAFNDAAPILSGTKVAAKVGYVNGAFQETTTSHATDYSNDTGVVIVPSGFTAYNRDDTNLLATLQADGFDVVTDDAFCYASPGSTANLNGHTALFVNLFETTESSDSMASGIEFTAENASITGSGQLISIGRPALDSTTRFSYGMYADGALTIDGPYVIGVGACSSYASRGVYAGNASDIEVKSGGLVGVGGYAGTLSAGILSSITGADGTVVAMGAARVLGVGDATGSNSYGIYANAETQDNACILGTGGIVSGNLISGGIRGTGVSSGGETIGVGGYASNYSGGIIGNLDARAGGKVVALGGVGKNISYGGCSYLAPETVQGDLIVAGRTRALYSGDGGDSRYQFTYADNCSATGYTDYAGTANATEIALGTTTNNLRSYKRIVVTSVDQPAAYPLYVAGVQVTGENAANLTAIPGVEVEEGGFARYDASTNTLDLKSATITNPAAEAEIVDPIVYRGDDDLTIKISGWCQLEGADGSYATGVDAGDTHGIDCGDADLAITFVDESASLDVTPGVPRTSNESSGLRAGSLSAGSLLEGSSDQQDTRFLQVYARNAFDGSGGSPIASFTCSIDLSGNMTISDNVDVFLRAPENSHLNTAGIRLRGDESTITMSDRASLLSTSDKYGLYTAPESGTEFDLQFVAEEGWEGSFNLCTNVESGDGHALYPNSTNATIAYTTDTCYMLGDNYGFTAPKMVPYPNESYTFAQISDNELIIDAMKFAYPLYVAGRQVNWRIRDDLTVIDGVSAEWGGHVRYEPETNMLDISKATITNPGNLEKNEAIYYDGDDALTISELGTTSTLQGADGDNTSGNGDTQGIYFGAADLTIELYSDANLIVKPGVPETGCNSYGIYGDGNLSVEVSGKREGVLSVGAPAATQGGSSYSFNLGGDLALSDNLTVYAQGADSTNSNTAGMLLRGTGATITLSDDTVFMLWGAQAGIDVDTCGEEGQFDLQVVAEEGWAGNVYACAETSSDSALRDISENANDESVATITRTSDTCDMQGYKTSSSDPDNLGKRIWTFDELSDYSAIELIPAKYFYVDVGSPTGGTYTYTTSYATSEEMDGWCCYTVESGESTTLAATPDAGYKFVGWYAGTKSEGSYYVDGYDPDKLVSSDAEFTFTPKNYAPLMPVFEPDYDSHPFTLVGVEVTSENADDIFGDGTASYDAATGTLTLENFAATGNEAGGAMLDAGWNNLTINLIGENALLSGTNAMGISAFGDVTFIGDGSLAVSGGYVAEGNDSYAISSNGSITFDESFTGTVAATGGTVAQAAGTGNTGSAGIFSAHPLTVKNGTVIATGGKADLSSGVVVKTDGVGVQGGVLVAQGGAATVASYGIKGRFDSQCTFTGGAAVVRAGTVGGQLGNDARAAFNEAVPALEGTKVAAKVGYVDGDFQDTTTSAGDYSLDTGVVIVPGGFASVSDISMLGETLSGDVYNVSSDGTNFGSNVAMSSLPLNLAGHTALFVNLYESTESGSELVGAAINAGSVSVAGSGQLIGVGGIALGSSYSMSSGLYVGGPLTIDGSSVVAVGGVAEGKGFGLQASNKVTAEDGNLVGVGGTSLNAYGHSYGIGNKSESNIPVEASGTAGIIGFGGVVLGNKSWGIYGRVTTNDSAAIMGAGGPSVGSNGYSEGIYDTATANGGTIIGIGSFGKSGSVGCNQGMDVYPGGLIVGLGGMTANANNGASYGSFTSPITSHAGDLVVAGRKRAFYYYDSYANYKFFSCAEGATGLAWTDYAGAGEGTYVDYDTTQHVISGFRRVVVTSGDQPEVYLCLGTTAGGTYSDPRVDDQVEGATVAIVGYGEEITLKATPLLGFRFVGWYEGITDDSSFVYDNTGELISDVAEYTFTAYHTVKMQAVFEPVEKWTRLAGNTRYKTMAAIVQQGFPCSNNTAIIATGENYPDALAASALSGFLGCPIILTKGDSLTAQAKQELLRLGVYKFYILGGKGAVSENVENQLRGLHPDWDPAVIEVTRLAGNTRTKTAVEIMKQVRGYSDTVIVATGYNFADSLSIGPWSYRSNSPILLTNKNGKLDAATLQAIQDCNAESASKGLKQYTNYIILGGTNAVSESVESQLEGIGLEPRIPSEPRIAGKTRYHTSQLIAEFSVGFGMSADYPAVATGENYPDALAAAPVQGKYNSIMVLVKNQKSPGIAMLAGDYYRDHLKHGYILGGTGVIPQSLMDYIIQVTTDGMTGSSALTAGKW